jgi:fumarate reductase subunit C
VSIFVVWFLLSIVIGAFANSRGRDWLRWFGIAALISPLIAGILLLTLPKKIATIEAEAIASGESKRCPKCAEIIRREAVKCRFCGSEIEAGPTLSSDEIAQRRYGG